MALELTNRSLIAPKIDLWFSRCDAEAYKYAYVRHNGQSGRAAEIAEL